MPMRRARRQIFITRSRCIRLTTILPQPAPSSFSPAVSVSIKYVVLQSEMCRQRRPCVTKQKITKTDLGPVSPS